MSNEKTPDQNLDQTPKSSLFQSVPTYQEQAQWEEITKALESNEGPELEGMIKNICDVMKTLGIPINPTSNEVTLPVKYKIKHWEKHMNYDRMTNVFTVRFMLGEHDKDPASLPPAEPIKIEGKSVMRRNELTKQEEEVKRVPLSRNIEFHFNDKTRVVDTIYQENWLLFDTDRYTNIYPYNDPKNNTNKTFKELIRIFHGDIKSWIDSEQILPK